MDYYTKEHVNNLQRYIEENFSLDGTSRHLIRNILDYVYEITCEGMGWDDFVSLLLYLLNGIGIDEDDIIKGTQGE